MSTLVLASSLAVFATGLAATLPRWYAAIRSARGDLRLAGLAWAVVFVGQGQLFTEEEAVAGAIYQLSWMAIGTAVIVAGFLKVRINMAGGTVAVLALATYGVFGVAGAAFSPLPLLSAYKASQILLDVILITFAISTLVRERRPRFVLDLTYFLLGLVLASAVLGGILWPDRAFKDIEAAYTGILNGVYPRIHSNELGLLGAIMLVVSIRRFVEPHLGTLRLYWAGVVAVALTVLFYAQARTSLASAALSIVVLSLFVPRLRPVSVIAAVFGAGLFAMLWLGDLDLTRDQAAVETYLRRGASDEQLQSLSGRIGLWDIGWQMFRDSPIFGHGMDAGVRFGGVAYGLPAGINMHSAHMQILVCNGITGYLAWLIFVLAVAYQIASTLIRAPGGLRREEGRMRLEMALVAFIILFRTFLGNVLVTHQLSFLMFDALLICAVVSRTATYPAPQPGSATPTKAASRLQTRRREGVWIAIKPDNVPTSAQGEETSRSPRPGQ